MTDYFEEALRCTIVNFSDESIDSIAGAKLVDGKAHGTYQIEACDIFIAVTDSESTIFPDLVGVGGLCLLVSSPHTEKVLPAEERNLFDGVIQCEPALFSLLLKDLVEPITTKSLIGVDCQDLGSFFSINKGKAIYKRGVLHGDTCEGFSVPVEFNTPELNLGLLAVLTDNYNTSYELFKATQRQLSSMDSVYYKALFDRLDNNVSEGLGLLWFENMKEGENT